MTHFKKLFLATAMFFAGPGLSLLHAQADPDSCTRVQYSFSSESTLKVNGKTNVNTFTCLNEKTLPSYVAVVCGYSTPENMEFLEAALRIPVDEMDCGGKGINADFREMMKADKHPYILLELWELYLNKARTNDAKYYTAITSITLVNTRRPVTIPVLLTKNGSDLYLVKGVVTLRLSDFGITPPKPLMGLIKINDEIVIEFALEMRLEV